MRIRSSLSIAAVMLLAFACKEGIGPQKAQPGPAVRATVVTLRTTIEPGRRVVMSSIVLARGKARPMFDRDVWRLFDFERSTVTLVDDIDRTWKTEPFDAFVKRRREAASKPNPTFVPDAELAHTGERRTILGTSAERLSVIAGGYRRDLWIGEHPALPQRLFSMMQMTETPSSPLFSMMRHVDEEVATLKGFPLLDRTELAIGETATIIERSVVSVVQRDVPESLFLVPKGYRDLSSAK